MSDRTQPKDLMTKYRQRDNRSQHKDWMFVNRPRRVDLMRRKQEALEDLHDSNDDDMDD
jgi:hypothetical protein